MLNVEIDLLFASRIYRFCVLTMVAWGLLSLNVRVLNVVFYVRCGFDKRSIHKLVVFSILTLNTVSE